MPIQITQQYFWSPLNIPGCVMWLDATDPTNNGASLSNNDPISKWYDKSSNSYTLDAGTSIPFYSSNTNGIYFDGSSRYQSDTVTLDATNHCLMAVINAPSPAAYVFNFQRTKSLGTDYIIFPYKDKDLVSDYSYYVTSYDGTDIDRLHSQLAIQNTSLVTNLITANIATNEQLIYLNGNLTNSSNVPLTIETSLGFSLGASYVDRLDTLTYFNGTINEVLIYDRQITTDERQQIEGYLARRWDFLSLLPNENPYKNMLPFQNTLLLPTPQTNPIFMTNANPSSQFSSVKNTISLVPF